MKALLLTIFTVLSFSSFGFIKGKFVDAHEMDSCGQKIVAFGVNYLSGKEIDYGLIRKRFNPFLTLDHYKLNDYLMLVKNGAPQRTVVEPQEPLENQPKPLEYNEKPLVATKTYFIKWLKDEVDLVELANNR